MRRTVHAAAVVAAALVVGCASRAPIVTDPSYPNFLYPTVPTALAGSESAEAHEAAWAYLQVGELATAAIHYERLLQRSSGFYPAEAGLGWVNLARGDAETAATNFSRARAADSAYVPALVGRGEAYLALNQSEEALASFEEALRADSGLSNLRQTIDELRFAVVSGRLSAARAATSDGRYDDARAAYQRVLDASPDSGFLHVELAQLEQQSGDAVRALEHARRAIELDGFDAEARLLEGELLEGLGDLEGALTSYERADAIDPSKESAARIDRTRERIRVAELPDEVREIAEKAEVTRGGLAALLGLRLTDLLAAARAGQSVIMIDAREHWGGEWIQAVVDAGVMRVDAAYRFDPSRPVQRAELAEVVAATLDLIASQSGRDVDAAGQPRLTDMQPRHLSYAAASRAVASGIIDLFEDDTFQPARTVPGSEATIVSERLAALNRDAR